MDFDRSQKVKRFRPLNGELVVWLKTELKVTVADLFSIEYEFGSRRIFMQMKDVKKLEKTVEEFGGIRSFRYGDGEEVRVSVASSEVNIKNIRVTNMPLHWHNDILRTAMSEYGKVMGVDYERWTKSASDGLFTGVRQVKLALTKHIPNFIKVNKHEVAVSYYGQPDTCRFCGSVEHFKKDCKQRNSYAAKVSGTAQKQTRDISEPNSPEVTEDVTPPHFPENGAGEGKSAEEAGGEGKGVAELNADRQPDGGSGGGRGNEADELTSPNQPSLTTVNGQNQLPSCTVGTGGGGAGQGGGVLTLTETVEISTVGPAATAPHRSLPAVPVSLVSGEGGDRTRHARDIQDVDVDSVDLNATIEEDIGGGVRYTEVKGKRNRKDLKVDTTAGDKEGSKSEGSPNPWGAAATPSSSAPCSPRKVFVSTCVLQSSNLVGEGQHTGRMQSHMTRSQQILRALSSERKSKLTAEPALLESLRDNKRALSTSPGGEEKEGKNKKKKEKKHRK